MSLYDTQALSSAASDPAAGWFLARTGEVPPGGFAPGLLQRLWKSLPHEKGGDWLRAVTGSLWLEQPLLQQEMVQWIGTDEGTLWEQSPPFPQLSACRAAVVLIPLQDGGNPTGRLLRLWLVHGTELHDHRDKLDGAHDFLEAKPDLRLFLDPLPQQAITGHSWQLAAHLAERVLTDNPPAAARKLARDWIITGAVDTEQRVTPVELGNKLLLPRAAPWRQWMLPRRSNPSDEFRREVRGGLAFVDTVNTAWQVLTGERTLEEDQPRRWPVGLEMHTFVSDALRPQLLAILLARPVKLVLWVSPEKTAKAALLRQVIEDCQRAGLECGEVCERAITASHIRKAEDELRKEGLDRSGQAILLHVTGGNLLMRYAAASLAQINPELTLIYRDYDSAEKEKNMPAHDPTRHTVFTTLRYEDRQGITGTFAGAELYPGASYEALTAHSEPEDDRQLLAGFFR